MSHVPDPYALILLALAAFRTWRLLAWDVVFRPYREWLIGRREEEQRALIKGRKYRGKVDVFVHCPWCLGAWLSACWWAAWLVTDYALVPAALLAVSALVGAFSGILSAITDD